MKARDLPQKLSLSKKCTVRDLSRYVKNRTDETPNYCILLGAGASQTSGINTGSELVKKWRREVFLDFNVDGDPQSANEQIKWLAENQTEWYDPKHEYSSLFERKYPLPKQRRVFIEKLVAGKLPSIGYSYLVRLAESSFFSTIFTTNFDDLLNEAFYQFSNYRPIVCAHDSSVNSISITSSRPKIVKIHGDYLFDNIKCTTSETKILEQNMSDKFAQFLQEYGLIIAGYSGSDRSVLNILKEKLQSDQHLENGLYWCFREDDVIDNNLLELFEEPRIFYVLIEGFDELMAELYSLLCEDCLPFNSQIASDRAQSLIGEYLKNEDLKKSKSPVIAKHLEELEKEIRSSEIFSAVQALNQDAMRDQKLSNMEILKFIRIEQVIQKRDYEKALNEIQREIDICEDLYFKKVLLSRLFVCAKILNKNNIAVEAANRMLKLEGDNIYVILDKVDALANYEERLSVLEDALKINDHYPDLINRLAEEKLKLIAFGHSDPNGDELQQVKKLIEKSISSNPRVTNPAWRMFYDFYKDQDLDPAEVELGMKYIIEEHLKQNPYSNLTTQMIFNYCKEKKERSYNGTDLFKILEEAFQKHFPKNYASHFAIYSNACIEYQEYGFLRNLIEKCDAIESLSEDEDYIVSKIKLQLDVYRDIHNCISLAESFLKTYRSIKVEKLLLRFYIKAGDFSKAENFLSILKGSISYSLYFESEAEIFEIEGRFQDAIDSIIRIPEKEFFWEKYTTIISYYYLRMAEYEKARKCCKEMLEKHNFSNKFQPDIINYEFSKLKLGKEVSKKRLNRILKNPNSDSVKAVVFLLLGDNPSALSILEKEMEKRFSAYYNFRRWPVLEGISDKIEEFGKSLFDKRRIFAKSDE